MSETHKARLVEILTAAYRLTTESVLPEVRITEDDRSAVFYSGGVKKADSKLSELGRAVIKKGRRAEGLPASKMDTVDLARLMLEDSSIFDRPC